LKFNVLKEIRSRDRRVLLWL